MVGKFVAPGRVVATIFRKKIVEFLLDDDEPLLK